MSAKIVIPEGMRDAAVSAACAVPMQGSNGSLMRVCVGLEAALLHLTENPIVPTDEQRAELGRLAPYEDSGNGRIHSWVAVEWQRRMFLAPEPEVPEEVKDLLVTVESIQSGGAQSIAGAAKELNERTIEAFNRGRKRGL